MKIRRSRRIWLTLIGVFVAAFLFTFLAQKFKGDGDAEAANLGAFDAGYIISDYQMGNYNSMSEAEIQSFLTSKNPCANTNYSYYLRLSANKNYTWHWADGHFVCLSEERFGDGEVIGSGETAAHIIWQAAQDYRINPQVLIVLLQKETGLITDPIPNNGDYRKATGYGCPDTAACSSKYYGFKNQVRNAAALFRTVLDGGWTNYPLGDNYIQYNPDSGCGGSVVNVRSLATSALYRYTPYQPNSAALSAGYGYGDGCSAYGNRNFYSYFEDWFGGITAADVIWEEMVNPRVMMVDRATSIIDAYSNTTTGVWLNVKENYFFTKKTTLYWGGEKHVCLQRRSDEGTNKCVLMVRLADASVEDLATMFETAREYEIIQWTCAVNLASQAVECWKKSYEQGDTLKVIGEIKIDSKEYLLTENSDAVLAARARRKVEFENIGTILMKLKEDSYKYEISTGKVVQVLKKNSTPFIRISEKVVIDGEVYYRTAVDTKYDNKYIILSSVLSENVFETFLLPRNLVVNSDTTSFDLGTGESCVNYKVGDVKKYINKINYDGAIYYQNEDEFGTRCVVKSSALSETKYNFKNTDANALFLDFVRPRNLKIKYGVYLVNLNDGTTCEKYLHTGDIKKYTTKATVDGMTFYRSEEDSIAGLTCAIPSEALTEI